MVFLAKLFLNGLKNNCPKAEEPGLCDLAFNGHINKNSNKQNLSEKNDHLEWETVLR